MEIRMKMSNLGTKISYKRLEEKLCGVGEGPALYKKI
jgi:hypothetical protein